MWKEFTFLPLVPSFNPILLSVVLLVGSMLTGNFIFHRPGKAIKFVVVVIGIGSTFRIIFFDNFLVTWTFICEMSSSPAVRAR